MKIKRTFFLKAYGIIREVLILPKWLQTEQSSSDGGKHMIKLRGYWECEVNKARKRSFARIDDISSGE